jgi:hypothetical protein
VCALDKFNNEHEAASSLARSLNFHAEIKSRCESRFWSLESVKDLRRQPLAGSRTAACGRARNIDHRLQSFESCKRFS